MPACDGCRRSLPDDQLLRDPMRFSDPKGPSVYRCLACRGAFAVVAADGSGSPAAYVLLGSAGAAMSAWWEWSRGDAPIVTLIWQAVPLDGEPPASVRVADASIPGDGLTPGGRAMLAAALPPDGARWPLWWNPADPATWQLVDRVAVQLPLSERAGPREAEEDIVTAAAHYSRRGPADSDIFRAAPSAAPEDAAAWWFEMLEPIHAARVAVARSGETGVEMLPIDPQDLPLADAASIYVDEPGFAAELRARAEAARRLARNLRRLRHRTW